MPLEKGQRVLPTITADAGSRPMTSKQARKAHQERSRGPKLTKEQRWSEERRLQAEIKRDIKRRDEEEKKAQERERNQLRGKQARDRAKMKEEAENAAKRKAGKPLKPPRPSQASILGFMRGNATAKKRAMVDEPDTKLPVIREESDSPASSAASSTKRRRLSDVNDTTDCPVPEEAPAEQAIRELDEAPPAEITNPEEETDDIPPLSLVDLALPGVPSGQATDLDHEDVQPEASAGPEEQTDIVPPLSPDNLAPPEVSSGQGTESHPPRSGQQQPEPEQEQDHELEREQENESRTASASPTPVSSPRASYTARNMSLTISFSLDDFEDALASAAQLDEELQGPDNTPAIDQAVEDTKTATSGVRDEAQDRDRTQPGPSTPNLELGHSNSPTTHHGPSPTPPYRSPHNYAKTPLSAVSSFSPRADS
ncbi:hypothetical protein B0T11DRAFT_317473 [Plectosphaerella cucumerina]|uniref:Uncharacterized protein n=1 Tax=Plectosphaerella cucumerina TaxID=40658 RepID=A0A8K0TEX9_9PEZI|nr:hypothetical protein B0T11DRAFT_317473 [Plectosphaerella cucumerina]